MLNSLPVCIQTRHVHSGPNKNVYYPQVTGLQDRVLESTINHAIVGQTQQLIDEQVGNMPTAVEEMIGLYELKNNQRQVLSLSLSNYTYHFQAAHGMTYIKSLTFDLEQGKQCELKDLFTPGSNYVERLSSLVSQQIKQRDIPVLGEFEGIRPNQDFYVADKTIVIYFQLYEMSPYAFGFPMFPISVYDLLDIINQNGPLGRLAANN